MCTCWRVGIRDRGSGAEVRYPNTCRDKDIPLADDVGWRVIMEPGVERFVDEILGPQEQDPSQQCGDLLVRDRKGNWTYQFAVTVDDHVAAHHRRDSRRGSAVFDRPPDSTRAAARTRARRRASGTTR